MEKLSLKTYKADFKAAFPGDESGDTRPRQTPGVLWSKALPTPVREPRLLAWSDELAAELGVEKPTSPEDIAILGGNAVTETMYPYAACYAGHQFGNWAGQLGDGRAITLGEWEAPSGDVWELQLKGAGPTAYSRRADGRAVLRSSVREYLMSEAMHYLGVPTTRALSLVATGDDVMRDMFYDGNAAFEPGAIVMRVAPTFLRFGNFEILAARDETDLLKQLADWTIERYYGHLSHITGEDKYLQFFKEVLSRTAALMVEWQRVGFVHGVMNTDNMSILGLTIDYGPYSFVDDYDTNFTPNTTDLPGRRYAFGRQPFIGHWNLGCLAGAIAPLFSGPEMLVAALEEYKTIYTQKYNDMFAAKLGLDALKPGDDALIAAFKEALQSIKPDMTIFFQLLADVPDAFKNEIEVLEHFKDSFYKDPYPGEATSLLELITQYSERLEMNAISREESRAIMQKTNPRFILRNYMLHEAIQGLEKGDDALFLKLQHAMKTPYSREHDEFFKKRPDWATKQAGCSMLSCSS
ncbi:MAG TPA: YdiU family protein [Patescibacteria group bacterium]|nr:YdiU family protein [Patescibacteria group bacterium]